MRHVVPAVLLLCLGGCSLLGAEPPPSSAPTAAASVAPGPSPTATSTATHEPSPSPAATPTEDIDDVSPSGDLPYVTVTVETDDPVAHELADVLEHHGNGINWGRWEDSYGLFSPAMKERRGSVDSWSADLGSSFWLGLVVHSVAVSDAGPSVDVTLVTEQDPAVQEDGLPCTVHAITYGFVPRTDGADALPWLIDRATQRSVDPCPGGE